MASNPLTKRTFWLFFVLFFLLVSATSLWTVAIWRLDRGLDELTEEGASKLDLYVTYLKGVLQKYESLPELLAVDKKLINALVLPDDEQQLAALNVYLETINTISATADIYLMNNKGLTLAASNWRDELSFVGKNFSYRPYFTEAMQGRLGRYYALGTTSSRRGYYFAYPVEANGQILGAVVIKINIDLVENAWEQKNKIFLITDPDGVVFITTRQDWRFLSLKPLAVEVEKRIVASKRYPNASFTPLTKVKRQLDVNRQLVSLSGGADGLDQEYLLQTRSMAEADWNVHVLSDTRTVRASVVWLNVMVASFLCLTAILFLLLRQRRARLAELERVKEKARMILQEANEQLELRVKERTCELTDINLLLRQEIQDRQRTEADLQNTRNELIHAAKLAALGQMSAGINHELNQPLAAIRSYTDNSMQFLEMGRYEDALGNLIQIAELTDRMARIGIQLKMFSRKSSGQIVVLPLHGVIDGALEILRPSLRSSRVSVQVRLNPEHLEVMANNVLLQQVLVNIIGNAIQAVEGAAEREIHLGAAAEGDTVIMQIRDSGPGIAAKDLPYIFDPFFTTKKSGQGLGLGLTISDRILRDMNGSLRVAVISVGACFEILLPKAP